MVGKIARLLACEYNHLLKGWVSSMATLERRGESFVVRVKAGGNRHTVYLAGVSEAAAEGARGWIAKLEAAHRKGLSVSVDERQWLAGLSDELHGRLAEIGLCEPRVVKLVERHTLGELIEMFKVREPAAKASTAAAREQAFRALTEYFTAKRNIDTIKAADVDQWFAQQLREKAKATASKRGQIVKRVFARAVRWEMLEKSPAAHLRLPEQRNNARQHFVEWAEVERVIAVCPDAEWKLIVALSRLAGLRIPTEILAMQWGDVDWENSTLTIRANKTHTRACPIFPELLPYLREQFDATPEGEKNVIHRHRLGGGNYATQLRRYIRRAGVKSWPRLWHNMRASRATELAGAYPGHVAAAWLGHSELIADRHYRTVRLADFQRAAQTATLPGSGQKSGQNDAEIRGIKGYPSSSTTGEKHKNPSITGVFSASNHGSKWAIQGSNL